MRFPVEPFYEEQRTTPDSTEEPMWGKRRKDKFFPWMSSSTHAAIFGWDITDCGPNVSPDGSVFIEGSDWQESSAEIDKLIKPLVKEMNKRLAETLSKLIGLE
jgi:hypothetical protein